MGRKPKPREVQIAEGRHKKNPKRFASPVPPTASAVPLMPPHFEGEAHAAWVQLERVMRPAGMWTATYEFAIQLFCESWAHYCAARDIVDATGIAITTEDASGETQTKRNAFSVEMHKYKDETIKLLTELGLTPSARSRVTVADSEEPDNLLKMLA